MKIFALFNRIFQRFFKDFSNDPVDENCSLFSHLFNYLIQSYTPTLAQVY